MKFLIMMNLYRCVDPYAFQTFTGMLLDIHNHGDNCTVMFSTTGNIALSRNRLFEVAALKHESYDYCLLLDDDHIFSSTKLYAMIKNLEDNKLPLLAAGYVARNTGGAPKWAFLKKNDAGRPELIPYVPGTTGLIEADVLAFGFAVMKPSFIYDVYSKEKAPYRMSADKGEDVTFCELVKSLGYPLFFDADNKVGHLDKIVV